MPAVIVNGYYKTAATEYQARRLYDEFTSLGAPCSVIYNTDIKTLERHKFSDKKVVFLDKDTDYARLLESDGVEVFNSAEAIELSDDKLKTMLKLRGVVKMPKTVFLPKIYDKFKGSISFNEKISNETGFPVIIKESIGSLGEQVYLAKNQEELEKITAGIRSAYFCQEFIKESAGKSLRIYVVGKKVLGGMRFVNGNDFRSNFTTGGGAERAELSPAFYEAAVSVAEKLGLAFCGLDFFDTEEPIFIEANSNAYFKSFEEAGGINVAKEVAKLILGDINE